MNKKAFTLIELLGAITILALLAAVVFPAVTNLLKTTNNNISDSTIELIKAAANDYVNDNAKDYPKAATDATDCDRAVSTGNTLKVSKLIEEGYLSEESFPDNTKSIKEKIITVKNTQYKYCFEID